MNINEISDKNKVDDLITLMLHNLDKIRDDLYIIKNSDITKNLATDMYKKMCQLNIDLDCATDEQRNTMWNIKKQYLTLFELYR